MYHKVWDHNALRKGFFKEFADDINAKIEDRTREIEMQKEIYEHEHSGKNDDRLCGNSF